jgi:Phytanoyl-CoA dioxygenase (PhyH)
MQPAPLGALDPTALATYRTGGYWIGPRAFDDNSVANLRAACGRVLSGEIDEPGSPHFHIDDSQPPGGLRRAFNASFVNSIVRSAVNHRLIGELAARLMGVHSVRLWYSQIIEKPAMSSSNSAEAANVGWHQDYRYWQCCKDPNMVTAWIALQETTRKNGAMRIVPGSHDWGLLPADKGFNVRKLDEMRETLRNGADRVWREEDCVLQAGQVSFHHSLTLHASGCNESLAPRIGLAIHMMPGAMMCAEDRACHHSLTFIAPLPRPGDGFVGRQWPVIWPPAQENLQR